MLEASEAVGVVERREEVEWARGKATGTGAVGFSGFAGEASSSDESSSDDSSKACTGVLLVTTPALGFSTLPPEVDPWSGLGCVRL